MVKILSNPLFASKLYNDFLVSPNNFGLKQQIPNSNFYKKYLYPNQNIVADNILMTPEKFEKLYELWNEIVKA